MLMNMNTCLTISFSIGLFLLLASCDNEGSRNQNQSSIEISTIIDATTESRYAYIKDQFESEGDLFIVVDYVDFLEGKEALEAEWRDEAYFVDGTDTMTNMTDGYYISNINPKLRTFKVAKEAKVENIIDGHGPHKLEEMKPIDATQLQKYKEVNMLIFIHVKEGVVQSIDERFLP